ncbi:hypothetical protein GCM10027406_01310 [Leifsonia lichenia]
MDDGTPKQSWWIIGRSVTAAALITVFFAGSFALAITRLLRTDLPDASPLLTWGGAGLSILGVGLGIASIVYHLRRDRRRREAGRDRGDRSNRGDRD